MTTRDPIAEPVLEAVLRWCESRGASVRLGLELPPGEPPADPEVPWTDAPLEVDEIVLDRMQIFLSLELDDDPDRTSCAVELICLVDMLDPSRDREEMAEHYAALAPEGVTVEGDATRGDPDDEEGGDDILWVAGRLGAADLEGGTLETRLAALVDFARRVRSEVSMLYLAPPLTPRHKEIPIR